MSNSDGLLGFTLIIHPSSYGLVLIFITQCINIRTHKIMTIMLPFLLREQRKTESHLTDNKMGENENENENENEKDFDQAKSFS